MRNHINEIVFFIVALIILIFIFHIFPIADLKDTIARIITSIIAAWLFLKIPKVFRNLRKRHLQKTELRRYLSQVIHSIENPQANTVLHSIYRRFDLGNQYVVPTLTSEQRGDLSGDDLVINMIGAGEWIPVPRIFGLGQKEGSCPVLIHGIFGSGKTALALYVNYKLAKRTLKLGFGRIPFYIPLRDFTQTSGKDPELFINNFVQRYGLYTYGTFRELTNNERIVLILDGFDQMAALKTGYDRLRFLNYVFILIARLNASLKVVITMRSDYLQSILAEFASGMPKEHPESDTAIKFPKVQMLKLGGLRDKEILNYLSKHPKTKLQDSQTILDKFVANVHLHEWVRHPLLLNMMLVIGGDILKMAGPLSLGNLFRLYTEHWFKYDSFIISLGSLHKKTLFCRDLAFTSIKTGEECIYLDDIRSATGEKYDWVTLAGNWSSAGQRYYDDETRSFLLVNNDYSVMFAHRALAEYFCADLALSIFQNSGRLPPDIGQFLYSNLIIWFIRTMVTQDDFNWVLKQTESPDVCHRCFGYALLPSVAIGRKGAILRLLVKRFHSEPDMDAKRHILFGIGGLGGNPCTNEFYSFLTNERAKWLAAPTPLYYRSIEDQREHCIRRLIAFKTGDKQFYEARGLYIFDLGSVGRECDATLIKEYLDDPDDIVKHIARESLGEIAKESHFDKKVEALVKGNIEKLYTKEAQ